jgi:heme o synthase
MHNTTNMEPASTHEPKAIALEGTPTSDLPGRLTDFYELTKPRMNFLVVITTAVGYYVATQVGNQSLVSWTLVHAILGTTLTAASASVMNQIVERDFDRLMPRTRNRPLAAERLGLGEAWVFAGLLGSAGVAWLWFWVNPLTSLLGAITLLTYVLIYTPMKRRTPLCTLVGAVPGAIPPMMGVTAFENQITPLAIALFAILFVWQMPHFFALALMYERDYRAGGFRMLPSCTNGDHRTRSQIILFASGLLPISLMPLFTSNAGWLYGVGAALLGGLFLWAAVLCALRKPGAERRLFLTSIIYLPLVLGVMMLDQ